MSEVELNLWLWWTTSKWNQKVSVNKRSIINRKLGIEEMIGEKRWDDQKHGEKSERAGFGIPCLSRTVEVRHVEYASKMTGEIESFDGK